MLQSTSAAHSEVRTAWRDTRRRRLEDLQQLSFVVLPVLTRPPEADALARQRTGDESRLPLPHYSLRIVRESCNSCDFLDARDDPP